MQRHFKALRKFATRIAGRLVKGAYVSVAVPAILTWRMSAIDNVVEEVAGAIEELNREGVAGPISPAEGRLTVFALSPRRFRDDLEVLAARPELRVLRMSMHWQRRMLRWFHGIWLEEHDIHNPRERSGSARARVAYRDFLRQFLPRLYDRLGVDVVIGANVRYLDDVDWGAVSQELGVPYVVFHRENLPIGQETRLFQRIRDRFQGFGSFAGECIVVHNNYTPNYFLKSDYADSNRIHVLGCLRMDPYLRRLQQPRPRRERPLVMLFSFRSDSQSTFGRRGYYPPFGDCHGALALLAQQHPELDVIMKPKPQSLRSPRWNRELHQAFRDWGVDPDKLPPNIQITCEGNAQDLILSASVVISLNSTTLIEAAIAGLPVIMPYFRYLREGAYARDVHLRDHVHLFDVPDTGDELIEMTLRRLRDPSISEDVMQARRLLFADAVSPLDGNASERYLELLQRVASEHRTRAVLNGGSATGECGKVALNGGR